MEQLPGDEKKEHLHEPQEWEWQLAEQEFKEHRDASRKRSHWLIVPIVLLLVAAFTFLSLPDLQILMADRFEFMSDHARLRDDAIVTAAKPAVVAIEASVGNALSHSVRQGTGFNLSPQGRIITNLHIVEDASKIKITFGNGQTFIIDQYSVVAGHDLAMIELDSRDLPSLAASPQGKPEHGEQVTIIGNPLGLQKIAQRGRVGQYHMTQSNQTLVFDVDVPANPGNSGSPVLNQQSQVIGVVFASTEIKKGEQIEIRTLAIPIQVLQYFPAT